MAIQEITRLFDFPYYQLETYHTHKVDKANDKLGKWEQVKAFELTSEVWGVENDLLTPTLKMKRKVILQHYEHLYIKIYKNLF
jgi:long-chain acyl-CoA synthetase